MKKGLPPPFHGPGGGGTDKMQTIYYQQGYPLESGIYAPASPHQHQSHCRQKAKKSLAEKLSKSLLDKLSPKDTRTVYRSYGQTEQLVPAYVYPVQYAGPGYGNQHGPLLYPWDVYNGQVIEYHNGGDLAYGPTSAPCACQDFGHHTETLRARPSAKCKKCRKPRTAWSPPVNPHSPAPSQYAKKLQQQEGIAPVPKKNLIYRDPYNYHGQPVRKVPNRGNKTDDEWQAYWEQEEEESDFVETKAIVPFAPSGLASKIRPRSKSPEPFRHLRVRKSNPSVSDLKIVERAIAQANKYETIKKNFSTFSPSPQKVASNEDKGSQNSDLKSEPNNNSKSEKQSEEETSVASDTNSSSSSSNSKSPQATRKQPILPGENNPTFEQLNQGGYKQSETQNSENKEEENSRDPNDDESDPERGLIDENTRRRLIEDAESLLNRSELRKPKKPRTADYRLRKRYLRRKNASASSGSGSGSSSTSFLLDEVILEEDEEALEAENLEVISSKPDIPVKSILKRPSTATSSDDSESESPSQKSSRDENETDEDSEGSLLRRRKKGVTFSANTETIDMGNAESTPPPSPTVPPPRLPSRTPPGETEDELTGYSKVVVSHNLAEEILDEIYGKMALDTSQTQYENSDFFSSGQPFFLFQNSDPNDLSEPPRSLADEILDELYGGDVKDLDGNENKCENDDDENYEEIGEMLNRGEDSDQKPNELSDQKKDPKNINPVLAELSRRFHRRQIHSVPTFALGPVAQSQAKQLRQDMSNLFNDTTRLRLKNRPSLAATMFFNEEPSARTSQNSGAKPERIYTDENGVPIFRKLPPRPKEPPPPPPPVASVLQPVTPPRKFFPIFTSDELARINDVINGRCVMGMRPNDLMNGRCVMGLRSNDVIREEEEDEEEGSEAGDEFSSDEFSDGEFDSLSNTYENLVGVKRTPPEGAESNSMEEENDNVYDVAEFVEKDSLENAASKNKGLLLLESSQMESIPNGIENPSNSDSQCLIENEGEKTIIFTSAAALANSSQIKERISAENNKNNNCPNNFLTSEHQILISSSSWIDLQGGNKTNSETDDNKNSDSPAFGSLPLVSCKFGASLPSDICKLEVGSIDVTGDTQRRLVHGSEWAVSGEPSITLDSLEPVKPPRLKKLAKLQQQLQQQHLQQQQQQNDLLRHVIHRDKFKMSNRSMHHHHHHYHHQHNQQQHHVHIQNRPDISAPILMATTLNPNDADAHRSLSAFSAGSILQHLEHLNQQQRHLPPSHSNSTRTRSQRGEKILTFREIKRTLASSFSGSFPAPNGRFIKGLSEGFSVGRSSFYEAEAAYEEAQSRPGSAAYSEHIYEEIPEHHRKTPENCEMAETNSVSTERPLPPIPEKSDSKTDIPEDEDKSADSTSRQPRRRAGSFFEGASKYEILLYLRDAKDRIGYSDFEIDLEQEELEDTFIGRRNAGNRVSSLSHLSDSSACSSNSGSGDGSVLHLPRLSRFIDIERTDSGVGSETSKTSKASVEIRRAASLSKSSDSGSSGPENVEEQNCQDCDQELVNEPEDDSSERLTSVVCKKCAKRRSERKEIITEIVETEIKYGRDLRIIVEEFYRPMLVAGLLTSEQLAAIFLNVDELIQVNSKFTESLKDAIEIAYEQGDEDLCTVRIGKHFFDSLSMLRAFESYCTRQGSASLLLTTLEKEKELLRIFLKVSQMENSMLRRMNLSSFLMVPVQRVTKYPLLLSRLFKVTPYHHEDRSTIKLSQERIEAALEQMNKDAKDVVNSSKLWRRLPMMTSSGSSSPSKKLDVQDELSNIKIQKMALEALGWKIEDVRFPLEGRILYTQPSEANWKKVWTNVKLIPVNCLLAVLTSDELPEISLNKELIFPSDSANIKDAYLIIVREKNSKYTLVRDPLPLDHCVICCEQDWDDCFEIQEFVNKESYVFKGEETDQTQMWFQTLQFYTQSLGGWRKRRKGLGNIMIDPNLVTPATPTSTPVSTPHEAEGASGSDAPSLAAEAIEKEIG